MPLTLSWERIDLVIDLGCAACLCFAVGCCVHSWNARVEQNSYRAHYSRRWGNSRAWVQGLRHSNLRVVMCRVCNTVVWTWCTNLWRQRAMLLQLAIGLCYSPRVEWFLHRRCAIESQETNLWTKSRTRSPALCRQTEFTESVDAAGQVVHKRLACLSVSPTMRPETNHDVNFEESGPVRADEVELHELMNAVWQMLIRMWFIRQKRLRMFLLFFPPRLSGIRHTSHVSLSKLVPCVCPWLRTFTWSSKSWHENERGVRGIDRLCGSPVSRAMRRPITWHTSSADRVTWQEYRHLESIGAAWGCDAPIFRKCSEVRSGLNTSQIRRPALKPSMTQPRLVGMARLCLKHLPRARTTERSNVLLNLCTDLQGPSETSWSPLLVWLVEQCSGCVCRCTNSPVVNAPDLLTWNLYKNSW